MTCFCKECAFGGRVAISPYFGANIPQNPILGAENKRFKPNVQNIKYSCLEKIRELTVEDCKEPVALGDIDNCQFYEARYTDYPCHI